MDFNPNQMKLLCLIFVGLHAAALPLFVWALRHRQFSGREQVEWYLEGMETPEAPPAMTALNARRAQWMVGVLGTLAALMVGSIFLMLFAALHATAHPMTGKCPF